MGVENRPTGDLNLMKAFGPSVQSPIKLILDKWKSNCQKKKFLWTEQQELSLLQPFRRFSISEYFVEQF